jgi:hypothetical protein
MHPSNQYPFSSNFALRLRKLKSWMIAGLFVTGMAQAADIYEGFNYTVGETLNSKEGGTGWATETNVGWRDGAGNAAGRTVGEGTLNFANVTSSGQKASLEGSRIFRNFATPMGPGTHYVRVLVQRANEETGYFGISLHDPATPDTNEKILLGKATGYQTWTINRVRTGTFDSQGVEITTLNSDVPTNEPSLLVLKIELVNPSEENPTGLDKVTFWVNPDLSKPERVANAVGGKSYTTTIDYTAISRVRIGGANTVNGFVDEIFISSNSVFAAGPEIVVEDSEGAVVGEDEAADFGEVGVNQSKTLTYTVKNLGNADLTNLAATITGENSPFTVEALQTTSVAPAASTLVNITYNPTMEGASTDTLTITSNDPFTESVTIALSGMGVVPELTVEQPGGTELANGGTLDFSNTGISQVITLKNTGKATLSDLAVGLSGDTQADFTLSELAVTELAPDASTTVTVTYQFGGPAPRQALLTITSNDPRDTTFEVVLTGGVPELAVELPGGTDLANGGTLDFGASGSSHIITLKNTGRATLSNLAVSLSSGSASNYEVSELAVSELAPNATTNVTVTFSISGPAPYQALLTVTSDDPNDNTFEVQLSGEAFGKMVGIPETEASLNAENIEWTEAAVGVYDGLLHQESTLIGAIESFKIAKPKKNSTGGGAATAKLRLDGRKIPVRGVFDANGVFNVTLNQKDGDPIVVNLQLQETETEAGGEVVRGTVVQGSLTATADLARAPYSNKNKAPSSQSGRFTLLVPVDPARLDTQPGGDGYAAVNISAAGVVKVAGVLGDGTKWTESGYLSEDGTFSLFNDLYKSKPKGIAGGKMTFRDLPAVSDFDGVLQWVKRTDSKEKIYPAGFSIEAWVIGSRFTAPTKGSYILAGLSDNANASLSLLWGRIYGTPEEQGEVTRMVTWTDKHKWMFAGNEKLSGNANKSTGLLTGSYRNPTDNKTLKIKGVVFQKQGLVGGQFAHPTGTGLIRMEPEAPLAP